MRVSKLKREAWFNFIQDSDSSTFFHTPQWYEIWSKLSYSKIESLAFETNSLLAILPLCSRRKKWFKKRKFVSSPQGTYGGLIYQNSISQHEIESIRSHLSKLNAFCIHSNPYTPALAFQNIELKPKTTQIFETSTIKAEVSSEWSNKHKASLKKSKKEKLSVIESNSLTDWQSYAKLYHNVVVARGEKSSNNYPSKMFELIFELDKSFRKLVLVKRNDEIVTGGIFFIYKHRMFYWHGASSPEGKSMFGAFAMIEYVLESCIASKTQILDFLPSGNNKGVTHFKKGFGTKTIVCDEYHF